jgi:hypothetical protein
MLNMTTRRRHDDDFTCYDRFVVSSLQRDLAGLVFPYILSNSESVI